MAGTMWRDRLYTSLSWLHRRAVDRLGGSTVGVRAFVLDPGERLLLVRHTYRSGWYLPGGGVQRGETAQQALRRELAEEVGLTLTAPPELFGVYFGRYEGINDFPVVFVVRRFEMAPAASPEIAERRWFALDEIPPDASPGTRRRIDELRRGAERSERW